MKINRMFIYAAALMVAACGKEVAPEGVTPDETVTPEYAVSFTAHTESDPASKATIGLNGENKPQTFWENGDIISVYSSGQTASNKIGFKFSTVLSSNSTSATFGYTGEDFVTGSYMAIYPHMEAARVANFTAQEDTEGNHEGTAYRMAAVDVPSTQTLVAGGFDRSAMIMMAYTDNPDQLNFKNAVALIKFKVSDNNITSGKISAKEPISGRFRAHILTETLEPILADYGKSTQNFVNFQSETSLSTNREYYVAVRPTTLASGFEIHLNGVLVKSYPSVSSFERNKIYDLGTITIPQGATQIVTKTLTFDFSDAEKMSGWPTSNKPTEYDPDDQISVTYKLGEIEYGFILTNPLGATENYPYFNVNRLTIPTHRYVGLPKIAGYKLTEVSFTVHTTGTKCGIANKLASGTSDPTFVNGGDAAKVDNFTLTGTEPDQQYWIKVYGAYALTELNLTYTQVTTQE